MIRVLNGRIACSVIVILASSVMADDWTRFRGPNGQGISSETDVPVTWQDKEGAKSSNIVWRTELSLQGWSSPIVTGDSVFLSGTQEDGKSCHIIRFDRNTGETLWNKEVHQQETTKMRSQNSYATPTPVTDGKLVYAVFFDGTALAIDFEGNVQWKNSEFQFYSLHGLGASPMLAGDVVIMPFDGSSQEHERVGWKEPWQKAAIVAWDCATGKVKWTGRRGESRVGHVTPILIEDGKRFVSAGGDRVQAFDVQTGDRVWSIYSQGEGVTPSPVLGDGVVFTSSGFEEPTIRAIRLGGEGDVTDSHIVWEQKRGVPALPSFLYVAPNLYSITRDNILCCLNASTGKIIWQERLDGKYSASPLLADGRIYITSEEGMTLVLEPGDVYKELGRNHVRGICKASIAVSDHQFFLRSSEYLYCIGQD